MQAAQEVSNGALTFFGLSSLRGNHCWWRHHHRNKYLNGDNVASVIVISLCENSRNVHNLQLVSALSLYSCAPEPVTAEKEKTIGHGVTALSHMSLSWLEFVFMIIPFYLFFPRCCRWYLEYLLTLFSFLFISEILLQYRKCEFSFSFVPHWSCYCLDRFSERELIR